MSLLSKDLDQIGVSDGFTLKKPSQVHDNVAEGSYFIQIDIQSITVLKLRIRLHLVVWWSFLTGGLRDGSLLLGREVCEHVNKLQVIKIVP